MIRNSIRSFVALLSLILLPALPVAAQELSNPLSTDDPQVFLANIIRIALGLLSVVALVMFVYGGFMFLTSGGNTDRITKAKGTLVWATIGLAVIFGSYSLLSFIVETIVKSTS